MQSAKANAPANAGLASKICSNFTSHGASARSCSAALADPRDSPARMRATTCAEKLLKYPGGGVSRFLNASNRRSESKLFSFSFILFQIIGQFRLHLLPRVKQPRPHRADVAVHDFRDLFMRLTLHIVQDDDQSMWFRQFQQRLVQFFLQFVQ